MNDTISHSGTKGMKWGYNDGQRNGKRTASELKKVEETRAKLAKTDKDVTAGSGDFEGDYHEANNMLKYLGITLDLQSDDVAVARTMSIYEQMRDTKDNYKTQYDWLNAFSQKLSNVGYDMKAVDDYLLQNKEQLNKITVGAGSGNREKSNQDWKDNDAKPEKPKSSKKIEPTSSKKSGDTDGRSNLKKAIDDHYEKRTGKNKKTTKHSMMVGDIEGTYLVHHGILGQKWGVRRYQNSDGSLTTLGRLRYGSSENFRNAQRYKAEKKKNKVNSRNQKIAVKLKQKYGVNEDVSKKKKSVKDMSDAELRARIDRLKLEDQYKEWESKVNPKVISKGEQFRKTFSDTAMTVVKEATKEAGKALLTDYMKKVGNEKLGLNTTNKYDSARKEAEYAKNRIDAKRNSLKLKDLEKNGIDSAFISEGKNDKKK